MNIRFEVAKILIELDRLNTLRNFTRQHGETAEPTLSWQAIRYSKLKSNSDADALLNAIAAYAALARGAGEAQQYYAQNPEWLFTFNRIGERLFFTLPEYLNDWARFCFNKNSADAFRLGWRGESLPSPL